MVKEYKFIRLEEETHALLDAVRQKDETYNVVVLKLLALSDAFDHHESVKAMIAVEDTDELYDIEEGERNGTAEVQMLGEPFSRTVAISKTSKIGVMKANEPTDNVE